ncbi:Gluconate transport-inducing protein, partial [Kickxella alabastrina]
MAETYHGFIDTAHDALLIFEACNNGFLSRVQRRFSDRERQNIRSGAVYVWDEEETGMRRWTDGRTWSPSRVHGCFLIYYEIEGRRHQFINKNTTNNGSSSRNSPRSGQIESSPFQSYDLCPPNIMQKKQGLIKKALSLCTNDKRRLHLVCYYSREDLKAGCLGSPTNDSRFAGIQVFEDRYPEIGHGMGRAERYGNGRGRASAETRPWDPTLPEAPIVTRNGPPAYVRSSMTIEKRSRSYRNEVFRYPNYGPYAGPVRHVNAPTLQGPSSYPSQGYQHNGDDNDANPQGTPFPGVQPTPIPRSYTPSAAVESTPSMVKLSGAMPTHGSQRQLHVPKLQLNALTPASVHYSVRAPTYEIGRGSTDFQPTGAGAAYGSHAYSYPSSMWKTAPMP